MPGPIFVGTAGWAIPRKERDRFPPTGAGLERYAQRFSAVEINSTFYRSHRADTYRRWSEAVPPGFRFAVKMRRTITHERGLAGCDDEVAGFLDEVGQLGARRGPVLVQLPPKLAFEASVALPFFSALRERFAGEVVCEPRHPSWFAPQVDGELAALAIGRVAADPPRHPAADGPGGLRDTAYFRLHGSPRLYWSAYDDDFLDRLELRLTEVARRARAAWCIFDNTGSGAAAANALDLLERLQHHEIMSCE